MNNTELETYLKLKYPRAEKTRAYLDLLPMPVIEYIYNRITGWPIPRVSTREQMSTMILQTQYMRAEDIERILYNYCLELEANALESSIE